jgi:hypothetical protein
MTLRRCILAALLLAPLCTPAQDHDPIMSRTPLTAEQVAVYRAVLKRRKPGPGDEIALLNTTSTPVMPNRRECLSDVDLASLKEAMRTVHRLGPSVVVGTGFRLVDEKWVRDNVDGTDRSESVDYLSEIVFDKEHLQAAVTEAWSGGELIGGAETWVYSKVGEDWKRTRKCGEAIE